MRPKASQDRGRRQPVRSPRLWHSLCPRPLCVASPAQTTCRKNGHTGSISLSGDRRVSSSVDLAGPLPDLGRGALLPLPCPPGSLGNTQGIRLPILTATREITLVRQNPTLSSLIPSRSLACKGSRIAELGGDLDSPFMETETEAQRGWGRVLSHTARRTKSHPSPGKLVCDTGPMRAAGWHPWRHFVTGSSVQTLLVLIWLSPLIWPAAWFPSAA